MAESIQDKGGLKERLDEDRRKMAIEVEELKKDYNPLNRLKESIEKSPWYWLAGALLLGFLLSHFSARGQIIYITRDSAQTIRASKDRNARAKRNRSQTVRQVWALIKPILTAYVGREIYQRTRTRPDVTPA
jgi:hypothetical protein